MNQRSVDPVHTAEWLAVLRIVVGLFFAKAIWTKMAVLMAGGVIPLPAASARWIETMPKIVAKQAAGNPLLWYKEFLETTVLPHSQLFAQLTAWGEVIVGVGLTLGLCTGLASLLGLWLVINYGLAAAWMTPNGFGFHYVLFWILVACFFARAGRRWGLDRWIAERKPGSILTRRPIS
jgi:thiosulfate dehydrogenase [quinone] large subunit